MNKFSGFLSTFLASLLAMVGIHLSAFAQVLNWSYEDIITDTYQSGANPEMVIDAFGDIHISYWNKEEDRLMYGVRDKSTGSWTITPVTTGSADGYASALKLDPAGNVHIASIVNQVGRAQLAYATNASGSWQTETITTAFDIGTYGTELVSPSYIQHSVDLTFQPNGDPAILFFDARINEIKTKLTETEALKKEAKLLLDEIKQEMEVFEARKKTILESADISTQRLIETRKKEMELMLARKEDSAIKSIDNQKEKASDQVRAEFIESVTKTVRAYLIETKNNSVSDEEIIAHLINTNKNI